MADIKVKDIAKKGVKTINKAVVQTERFKDNIELTKGCGFTSTHEVKMVIYISIKYLVLVMLVSQR